MLTWKNILHFISKGNPTPDQRLEKTEEEWANRLSEKQFFITRKHGTEASFSNDLCSSFEPGLYGCVCCETLLFDATKKFESGSGWPSFTQPISENSIKYIKDTSYGMLRVEAQCNTCDSHLGHVFPDGPEPSGLRYCINGEALIKK